MADQILQKLCHKGRCVAELTCCRAAPGHRGQRPEEAGATPLHGAHGLLPLLRTTGLRVRTLNRGCLGR